MISDTARYSDQLFAYKQQVGEITLLLRDIDKAPTPDLLGKLGEKSVNLKKRSHWLMDAWRKENR